MLIKSHIIIANAFPYCSIYYVGTNVWSVFKRNLKAIFICLHIDLFNHKVSSWFDLPRTSHLSWWWSGLSGLLNLTPRGHTGDKKSGGKNQVNYWKRLWEKMLKSGEKNKNTLGKCTKRSLLCPTNYGILAW